MVQFVAPAEFPTISPPHQGGDEYADSDADPATGRTAVIDVVAGTHVRTIDAGLSDYPTLDFGDAPAPYPTTLAAGGAHHTVVLDVYLGNTVDRELDGREDPDALGDDNAKLDDEDGVVVDAFLVAGQTAQITVTASVAGKLDAWLDLNGDGDWDDQVDGQDEHIFVSESLVAGPNDLSFDVPAGAAPGYTFARFRFSTVGGLDYDGPAADGEVEDYRVGIDDAEVLLDGRTVVANGGALDDHFQFDTVGSMYHVTLSGRLHEFTIVDVDTVEFHGGPGNDSAVVRGSAETETFTGYLGSATLTRTGLEVAVDETEEIVVTSGGGPDVGHLHGTAENETYIGRDTHGLLSAEGGTLTVKAIGYPELHAAGEGGDDQAKLYDAAGPQVVVASPDEATLSDADYSHHVMQFPDARFFASGDVGDEADLYDGAGAIDKFTGRLDRASMSGPGYANYAEGLVTVRGHSSGDFVDRVTHDTAVLFGSVGNDRYDGWQDRGAFQGTISETQYVNQADTTFPEIHVISKRQGADEAYLHGTAGKDRFQGTRAYGRLSGPRDAGGTYFHRVVRFPKTYVTSGDGPDVARLTDSRFNDTFEGAPGVCVHRVGPFEQTIEDFPTVIASAVEGGRDTADVGYYDGDTIVQRDNWAAVSGADYLVRVEEYETVILTPMSPPPGAALKAPVSGDSSGDPTGAARLSDADLAALALARATAETDSADDDESDLAVDEAMAAQPWWLEG
jgi:hypothetical protein